jgi:hypothetical protein
MTIRHVCALAVLVGVATPASANRTSARDAVMASLTSIKRSLTSTKYEHRARIDVARGVYWWDCSIMAAWILAKTAPESRRALAADKPLARDFYRTIAAAKIAPGRRAGWQRVPGPVNAEPGDVFAWLKPEMFKQRKNTGHVGFLVGKPWRHPKHPAVWLARIADATTELHGDDSRPAGGGGGFGTATIGFLVDASGNAVAYGWYGEAQDPLTYVPTPIVFGRVLR